MYPSYRLRATKASSLINVLQGLSSKKVFWSRGNGCLEKESLLTYSAMTNLAGIYQYQGQYKVAPADRIHLLGEHPWAFWTQMSLGTVWAECGRLSKSLKMFKCASNGLLKTLQVARPMTLMAEANLGYAYT
jgi:hypothetical protein